MSQAKRTFQGKNFANLQENYSIKIRLDDQKENENVNNMVEPDNCHYRLDTESESHEQSDLYSHLNKNSFAKKMSKKKSYSPPLKVNSNKVKDLDMSSKHNTTIKIDHRVITED